MTENVILNIIGWVVAGLTCGLGAMFGYNIRQSGRISNTESCITGVKKDIEWIIRTLGVKAARTLHSPHTPELDKLIEKYECNQLLWHEIADFALMLKAIESDFKASKGDRLAAGILLLSLEKSFGSIVKDNPPVAEQPSPLSPAT